MDYDALLPAIAACLQDGRRILDPLDIDSMIHKLQGFVQQSLEICTIADRQRSGRMRNLAQFIGGFVAGWSDGYFDAFCTSRRAPFLPMLPSEYDVDVPKRRSRGCANKSATQRVDRVREFDLARHKMHTTVWGAILRVLRPDGRVILYDVFDRSQPSSDPRHLWDDHALADLGLEFIECRTFDIVVTSKRSAPRKTKLAGEVRAYQWPPSSEILANPEGTVAWPN